MFPLVVHTKIMLPALLGLLLFLTPFIASADVVRFTIGEQFLQLLFLVFVEGPPLSFIFLLPFVVFAAVGLFFSKKFIALWNISIMLGTLFVLGAAAEMFSTGAFRGAIFQYPLILAAVLYSSLISIVMLGSSAIGRRLRRMRDVQEVIDRMREPRKAAALFGIYLIYFLSYIFILFLNRSGTSTSFTLAAFVAVHVAILLAVVVTLSYFYRKAKDLSQKATHSKKDIWYFFVPFIIFVTSLALSFGVQAVF